MNPEDMMMAEQYQGGLGAQASAVQGAPYAQSPQMPDPSGAGAGGREELLQEVVRMLMEGTDPDELAAQGVPYDVLEEAMQIVLQQVGGSDVPTSMAAQGQQQTLDTPYDGGLAASM